MRRLTRTTVPRTVWTLPFAVLVGVQLTAGQGSRLANAQSEKERTYVGTTKCAACHFPQYKSWKTSPHGKAFEVLPAKYKKDAECLKCHTTGFGHESGFKDASSTGFAGISCEACHGAGSEHTRVALRFVDEGITEEGEKRLRTTIQRIAGDPCIKCHLSQAHKTHPPFERENTTGKTSQLNVPRSAGFFGFSAH